MSQAQITVRNTPARSASPAWRWVVVGLVFAATTLNYVDRQVIALLKPVLSADLHWSDRDYASVISVFQLCATVALLVSGWFIDRTGLRWGYAAGVGAWSLAGMAHGVARTVGQFALARGVLGAAEAVNTPASLKAVATWFAPEERALVIGLGNAAPNLGAVLTPLIVAPLGVWLGWRGAFLATGAAGLVWLAVWLALPRPKDPAAAEAAAPASYIPFGKLLHDRDLWAFALAKALTDPVWWLLLFWAPDLLHRRYGLDLAASAAPLATIYLLAAAGAFGGGLLPGLLRRFGATPGLARRGALAIGALPPLALLLVGGAGSVWSTVWLLGLTLFGHQVVSTNLFAFATDRFPGPVLGRATAFGAFCGNLAGLAMLQAAGAVLQATGGYGPLLVYGAFAYLAAVLALQALASPPARAS